MPLRLGTPHDLILVTSLAAGLGLAGGSADAVRTRPRMPLITKPVPFGTPEADRILAALQVFPSDNPWNEDISERPLHPRSAAMIEKIGPDKPLDYNLDMNFVIVAREPEARGGRDHGVPPGVRPGTVPHSR